MLKYTKLKKEVRTMSNVYDFTVKDRAGNDVSLKTMRERSFL